MDMIYILNKLRVVFLHFILDTQPQLVVSIAVQVASGDGVAMEFMRYFPRGCIVYSRGCDA